MGLGADLLLVGPNRRWTQAFENLVAAPLAFEILAATQVGIWRLARGQAFGSAYDPLERGQRDIPCARMEDNHFVDEGMHGAPFTIRPAREPIPGSNDRLHVIGEENLYVVQHLARDSATTSVVIFDQVRSRVQRIVDVALDDADLDVGVVQRSRSTLSGGGIHR